MDIMEKVKGILPMLPWEGPPLPGGMVTSSPLASPLTKVKPGWENLKATIQAVKNAPTFEEKFNRFIEGAAPPVPDIDGLPELRIKANAVLAPMLLNKWLPPVPAGLAKTMKR